MSDGFTTADGQFWDKRGPRFTQIVAVQDRLHGLDQYGFIWVYLDAMNAPNNGWTRLALPQVETA